MAKADDRASQRGAMGQGRLTALLLAVVIIILAFMRTATATHTTGHKAFSGGADFRGLVVKTSDNSTISAAGDSWQIVDSRGFQIPAGESQLIVVDFFAGTFCEGSSGFCRVRALAGRTLNTAQELEYAGSNIFAVAGQGSDANEMSGISRALCVRNATASPLDISVWLQASKTSSFTISNYQLLRWTFKIARNAPCSPSVDI